MRKTGQARFGGRRSWEIAAKKSLAVFMAFMLLYVVWPMKELEAARITRFSISDGEKPYLIAGVEYAIFYDSDKASTTKVVDYTEYSIDNGGIWRYLPRSDGSNNCFQGCIRMPIDPQITSALIRVGADFIPLIGSRTHSEKTVGPYKILQPADPTDFTATPGNDGTITLTWNDNSNMESSYRIIRYGPDGTKQFYANNTTDHIGPLSYVDNQTDKSKSTIYVYSLSAVIDKYELPEDLQPGSSNVIAKSKVPINPLDKWKLPLDVSVIVPSDNKKIDYVSKIVEKYPIIASAFDKLDFSSLKLNKNSMELKPGESETLSASFSPANTANQKIKWSSSSTGVAEVDANGKVTGKKQGIAKITVETENGSLSDVCTVHVIMPGEPPKPQGETSPEPPDKSPEPPAEMPIFSDIAGHKAGAEISAAAALGFIGGYPDGTFRPDANVTRAEFATMLIKALKPKVTVSGTEMTFADLDQIGVWAISYVAEAVKLEIINGYEDFTFRPNANITHAEMIAMVIRASGLKTDNAQQTGLADDAEIPGWAKPSVSKAMETGIIIVGGLPDRKFSPQAMSTRAEAASAIVRMLEAGRKK
ncbi:S-layer homology domain-containing protein [Paenibacillus hamazuiensis]|uniref:S-layer homology domain-containing protein n=1 Tax=Paenibacillus hamazuiensis TaxID=2936508 RepID=UPI00200EC914|nr:S-layer homology domain-containing protein [Paenibacillus hamazuiensis]